MLTDGAPGDLVVVTSHPACSPLEICGKIENSLLDVSVGIHTTSGGVNGYDGRASQIFAKKRGPT
jgi:hypothetical protein